MSISHYIKDIGRGRDGARALDRAQATDLMGQILDGNVSDLELGAFCIAMRIKGETAEEMAGFLDATHARLQHISASSPVVVLPSYNGARKLPVLTALLAHLLAREGLAVVMHGTATESSRITSQEVLSAMGVTALDQACAVQAGEVVFAPTEVLCPGLKRLLDVRRVVGLRNPAHSLVKLMNPTTEANALLVSSYTHPEYAISMAATFELTGARALLLRGTEGEVVADARRTPQMAAFVRGTRTPLVEAQAGSLIKLPELPTDIDAASTARYTQAVLNGELPVPAPLAAQVQAVLKALSL
ncbi:DNA-binding protein YbiB [Limnohabitans sp. Rim8]|uniref:DNA-binding protein YbiB n=1 Tax=Limnohabitans sp. Rim8 TaxID=1100718 RepID=UPI000D347E86|nr:DNA-binding protein YbiB [Limnohabitans sp. Rim8]PUE57658.1 DNA-binding protein YbiB [Limnohabitans sp. Rim8]